MKRTALFLTLAGLALVSSASAQGFNIDIGATYGTPPATFGAGAGQVGLWNNVLGVQGSTPLTDLNGTPTGAMITCVGAGSYDFSFNNASTTGSDEMLMDDGSDPSPAATWSITGLAPGNYVLYTYAWAPDSSTYVSHVDVTGSSDPAQDVGGAWPGGYLQGVTHAVHHITISAGGTADMNISVTSSFATLNGFQLVGDTSGVPFCNPGLAGVIACPCANPPSGSGRGCNNSSATGGASLTATGSPMLANDTLHFATAGEKPTATSILLQGNASNATGLVFGQGVRCVAGVLKRLYVATASGGSISVPPAGGPSVSARSASLGDTIAAGSNRYYMTYYRDPIVLGGCSASGTFNGTNALQVTWQ